MQHQIDLMQAAQLPQTPCFEIKYGTISLYCGKYITCLDGAQAPDYEDASCNSCLLIEKRKQETMPAKGGMVWKQVNRAALVPHCKISGDVFLLIGFCCFPTRTDSLASMVLKAKLGMFSVNRSQAGNCGYCPTGMIEWYTVLWQIYSSPEITVSSH